MNKKIITTLLIILVILLIIAAVFIGIRLSTTTTTTPEDIRAIPSNIEFTNIPCSGSCESGEECNDDGNPPVGKMWACYYNSTVSAYRCAYVDINDGDPQCYLSCSTNSWLPCGCDEDECQQRCEEELENDPDLENATITMKCDGCQQEFTCECERTATPTPTPTQTPTATPSQTPTETPTGTISPTPTLPTTALVSNEIDTIIIGIILIILGMGFYKIGIINLMERVMWHTEGRGVLSKYQTKYYKEKINSEREDFEEKIIQD